MVDTAQTYANLYKLIDNSTFNCPQDYTYCSRYDRREFDFCVKGIDCPLTKLVITATSENPEPSIYSKRIQTSDGQYMWLSNKQITGPITDLVISQGIPCFNRREISWNIRPTLQLNHENVRNCNYMDSRYTDLKVNIDEIKLFELNGADHSVIYLLDKQPRIWSKYYRPLFPIKTSCSDLTDKILS
jgi:hypothetical protein